MLCRESQYLVGFVLRRDLLLAFENARARLESLPGNSLCVFTQHVPVVGSGPPPLKLRKIVDLAPITITDQVPNNQTPKHMVLLKTPSLHIIHV